MNLQPGTILYFTPFHFADGRAAPKNKYFLVLALEGADWLVASLPSSVDRVPSGVPQEHGCLHLPKAMFHVYIFEAGRPIATNGWAFPRTTYVYAVWVERFERRIFREVYVVEGVDYTVVGRLSRGEYEALVHCALTSGDLKRRYRRVLEQATYDQRAGR